MARVGRSILTRQSHMSHIRAATALDAPQICAVHLSAIREVCASSYTQEQVQTWLEGKRPERYLHAIAQGFFFVAVVREAVVGFAELDSRTAEICAVYVSPTCLRQGIGTALLRHLERAALAQNIPRLHLRASLNSIPFYAAHGYILERMATTRLKHRIDLQCGIMSKAFPALPET